MKSFARRLLRRFYAGGLRRRSQALVLPQAGTLLVLAPHPDDETLGCGALIARRGRLGLDTVVAFFTGGEGSHPDHPSLSAAQVAALRREESLRAMSLAQVPPDRVRFCGAPDGRLNALTADERQQWITRLAALIAEVSPSTVLLPCRDDGSSEHEAMFGLFAQALGRKPAPAPRVLEFPVWSWWSPTLLGRLIRPGRAVWRQPTGAFAADKRAMLRCYVSQLEPTAPLRRAVLPPGFPAAFDGAEEFFLESPIP